MVYVIKISSFFKIVLYGVIDKKIAESAMKRLFVIDVVSLL